jgi:hypothetical protein
MNKFRLLFQIFLVLVFLAGLYVILKLSKMGKRETFYEGADEDVVDNENEDLDVSNVDLDVSNAEVDDSQNAEVENSVPVIQLSSDNSLPTPAISEIPVEPTPISIIISKNDVTTLAPIDISKIMTTTPYSTYVTEPPQEEEEEEEEEEVPEEPELEYGMTTTPYAVYTTTAVPEEPEVTEEKEEEVTLAPEETTTPLPEETTTPFPEETTTLAPYQGSSAMTPLPLTTSSTPAGVPFPKETPYYNPGSTDTGYKAFDPLSFDIDNYEYIAKVNKSTQPDGLSDNPMDPNWGGVMYTQKILNTGKYDENIITKPLLFQPKGIFIDGIPSPFDKPKDIL